MKATGAVTLSSSRLVNGISGVAGPNNYDCSGLVMKASESVGVTLKRTTWDQWNQGRAVSRAELQPDDLVFYNNRSHVAMYVGNNEVIQALKSGTQVSYYSISYAGSIDGYRRYA
jgi:peptidoglycan DL-endopeptidase CwlO